MPDDQPLPFVNSDLDRTDKSLFGFMRAHYSAMAWIYVPMNVICIADFVAILTKGVLLARFLPGGVMTPEVAGILYIIFIISLAYVVSAAAFTRAKMANDFARRFARLMGYAFDASAPLASVSGDIFAVGRGARISDVCSGAYADHPVRLFEYQCTIREGKSHRTLFYTMLEVRFPHALSEMRIIPSVAKGFGGFATGDRAIDVHFSSPMKIALEGDFSQYFSVYAPPNTQIEDLEIMTPDFMAWLIDRFAEYGKIGFECDTDKLYVHISGAINAQKIVDFSALYSLAGELIPKLDRVTPMGE